MQGCVDDSNQSDLHHFFANQSLCHNNQLDDVIPFARTCYIMFRRNHSPLWMLTQKNQIAHDQRVVFLIELINLIKCDFLDECQVMAFSTASCIYRLLHLTD